MNFYNFFRGQHYLPMDSQRTHVGVQVLVGLRIRVDKNTPHIELGHWILAFMGTVGPSPQLTQLVRRHVAGYENLDGFLGCIRDMVENWKIG